MATYSYTHHAYDVVIVGAGGAGLRAAIAACDKGLRVAVISKVPPTRSHTVAAQGGINAALGNRTPDDWRWHMYDTVRGSDWLGDQDAIAFMCQEAPKAIIELERLGMAFSRQDDGRIYQRAYGGQATYYGKGPMAYRACAVADRTGHALLHTLYGAAHSKGVKFFIEWMALDIVTDAAGNCRGVLAWEMDSGELHAFSAHAVILATGGFGQVYAQTTASSICTGDGGGMALRANLPLQDMEFVQFHPTGLYGTGILITEGARGEGAYLVNSKGERFMERYAPKYRDLASRDVISRSMVRELMKGRGCGPGADHLLLNLDHIDSDTLRNKLPNILDIAKTFLNIDATQSPLPVVPSVHYTMGGIPTDYGCNAITGSEDGAPYMHGLLAIGEAACNSVHGANRLGCNALLDLVVFGKLAGEQAANYVSPGTRAPALTASMLERPLAHLDRLRTTRGTLKPAQLRKQVQNIMSRHAGIFRDNAVLSEGLNLLQVSWDQFRTELRVADSGMIWNNDLMGAVELDNLLRQSIVTMASALQRTESRGAHYRDDYPVRNDRRWLRHSLAWMEDDGGLKLATRPVRMESGIEGLSSFEPETRAY